MKKLILLGLLVLSGQANATQITMTNPRGRADRERKNAMHL